MVRGNSVTETGFTLIELMVTVAVLAVVISIAAPAFDGVALSSRLTTVGNDFVASAQIARSEAIKRNRSVRLCASSNGTACGGTWQQGWIVVTTDASPIVVKRWQALPVGYLMQGQATTVDFDSSGGSSTQLVLQVCRSSPNTGDRESKITLFASGRATAEKIPITTCVSS